MNKLILITGLDGSGKSTLLSKLAAQFPNNSIGMLLLPHINVEAFRQDPEIYRTALFINALGKEADTLQVPQLKAIALFASMLLFKPMLHFKLQRGAKTIFCERHPLIDTSIYARFYAEKLKPGSVSKKVLDDLDAQYPEALTYLLNLFPKGLLIQDSGKAEALMHFIYQWFFVEKKLELHHLEGLFDLGLPDQIFYLKADPEVLFERIKNRALREAHESVQVFKMLGEAYEQLFEQLKTTKPGLVDVIDGNRTEALDLFYEQVCIAVQN